MTTTTVSPPAFTEEQVDELIATCRRDHDDDTLLYLLVMAIEHVQYLALEAGLGGIYNTGCIARVALSELALRGTTTLTEGMLAEAINRMESEDDAG